MKHTPLVPTSLLSMLVAGMACGTTAGGAQPDEANVPVEIKFHAAKSHPEPFKEASLDVVFTDPAGQSRN